MLDYIVWNMQPEIIEGFRVRWYGLFFAIGFFVSYSCLSKIFNREGLSQKELDRFTFLTFVLLIVGLRLGHTLFYEWDFYSQNPLRILYIWEGGLASHGGAIGLLLAFFLFSRRSGRSFLWITSRAAIVIPFTAGCVRLGNLMNSEIYGVATNLPWAFVFLRDSVIQASPQQLTDILTQSGVVSATAYNQLLDFFTTHAQVFAHGLPYSSLKAILVENHFMIADRSNVLVQALVNHGLLQAHHPTQMYEALVYFATFAVLMYYYFSRKTVAHVSQYFILGFILVVVFGFRFVVEFIKNNQVDFEQSMPLNMGQLLSLPFIVFGVWCWYKFFTAKE
ncbi:MAG: prolipoprotein diacylglyceryl transferase [Bacteroidales bacterium]|jgi:prolipoprotein diacylglyceryl transferase|nr:prolipoprotein diacylglyceryl transferase [Bacteroidales bacterium]